MNIRFANRTQIPGQQTPTIVEVSIGDNGTWVKVQTNGRDRKVGSVICRQLGQGPVFNAVTVIADSGMNYYTVICEGTEASLKDCSIKTKTSDYTHPLFLYVQCLPPHAQGMCISQSMSLMECQCLVYIMYYNYQVLSFYFKFHVWVMPQRFYDSISSDIISKGCCYGPQIANLKAKL